MRSAPPACACHALYLGSLQKFWGTGTPPPSPRFLGMRDVAANCELIYGAQSATGKILVVKSLTVGWEVRSRTALPSVLPNMSFRGFRSKGRSSQCRRGKHSRKSGRERKEESGFGR